MARLPFDSTRLWLVAAALCWLLVAVPSPVLGQPGDVAVIVNPGAPLDNVTMADLRRLWLGDRDFLASGVRVTLLIRAPVARERDVIVKSICQMTEAQFRQHWIAKVFRADTVTGPKLVYSNDTAIEQVGRTPGGIAFVEGPVASRAVKVLRVDGKLPGQAGYPLK